MIGNSVREFGGAAGDGRPGDGAAFNRTVRQSLIDGYPVEIEPGEYLIDEPVLVPESLGLMMRGCGDRSKLIAAPGLNDYVIRFAPAEGLVRGFRLLDVAVDGNCTQQTAGGCVGALGAYQCHFVRVHAHGGHTDGVVIAGANGHFGHHNRVTSLLIDGGNASPGPGHGLRWYAADENTATDTDVEDCKVGVMDQSGLNTHTAGSYVNNGVGLWVKDTGGVTVQGGTFDGNKGPAIIVSGYECTLSGAHFLEGAAGQPYVLINNDGRYAITGNTFRHPKHRTMATFVRETAAARDGLVEHNQFTQMPYGFRPLDLANTLAARNRSTYATS